MVFTESGESGQTELVIVEVSNCEESSKEVAANFITNEHTDFSQ